MADNGKKLSPFACRLLDSAALLNGGKHSLSECLDTCGMLKLRKMSPVLKHEFVCLSKAPRTVTADLADQVTLITYQIIPQAHKEIGAVDPATGPSIAPLQAPAFGFSSLVL